MLYSPIKVLQGSIALHLGSSDLFISIIVYLFLIQEALIVTFCILGVLVICYIKINYMIATWRDWNIFHALVYK